MDLITFHSARNVRTIASKHCLMEYIHPMLSIILHIAASLTKMGQEPVFTRMERKKWKKEGKKKTNLPEVWHLLRPLFNDLKCYVCVSLTANVIFYSNSFIPSQQPCQQGFFYIDIFIHIYIYFFKAVASFATIVISHMPCDCGQCSSADIIHRLRRSALVISVGLTLSHLEKYLKLFFTFDLKH